MARVLTGATPPSWLDVRVKQRVEPSLDRLFLDLLTSRSERRSELFASLLSRPARRSPAIKLEREPPGVGLEL
jgi:hypothetical protein